jgi:thioredoxin reductase (NADPH)
MKDIIIIGAGPAGMTAALYALRADKSVLLLEKENFGGQITYSPKLENYPSVMEISGSAFAEKMLEQVMAHGADIELAAAEKITDMGDYKIVSTEYGDFEGKAVIIATGSKHRHLGIDREEDFVGEGISYCAVCDGAFYKGKSVAVIGGGNSALVDAVLLSESCTKVYVVQNLGFLTGESRLVKTLEKRDNVEFIYNSVVRRILGGKSFEGIEIEDTEKNELTTLNVDGIFVAIGQVPENEPFAPNVKLNGYGYIEAGESCIPTAEGGFDTSGIFTAGDCRTKTVRQVTTATADGAVSALAACRFIDSL